MRKICPVLLVVAGLLIGCSSRGPSDTVDPAAATNSQTGRTVDGSTSQDVAGDRQDLGFTPQEFRSRWNEVLDQAEGNIRFVGHLALDPLQRSGDSVSTELADDIKILGRLSSAGAVEELRISAMKDSSPTTTERRTLTHSILPTLLVAATLPSRPSANNGVVTELAKEISIHDWSAVAGDRKSAGAEDTTYTVTEEDEAFAFVVTHD